MRYFDTKTRTETNVQSSTTIPMTDERVSWWFEPLGNGVEVVYDDNGLPHKTQVGQFVNPIVVNGVVVEGMSQDEILKGKKYQKLKEIREAKKVYQERNIVSNIGGRDYNFFGGIDSARKYKDTLDLSISLGLTEVTVKVEEGLIHITNTDIETALVAISIQVYNGWLKESYHVDMVNKAKTVEEVNSVYWEDTTSYDTAGATYVAPNNTILDTTNSLILDINGNPLIET